MRITHMMNEDEEKCETKIKKSQKEKWRGNLHVVQFCVKIGGGTRTPYDFENVAQNLIL